MHVKKNVSRSVLGFLLDEKDTIAVWKDMEAIEIRRPLHLQPRPRRGSAFKPHAPYVLKPSESSTFMKTVKAIKIPTSYSSNMTKHVSERNL